MESQRKLSLLSLCLQMLRAGCIVLAVFTGWPARAAPSSATILVYHRFGPQVADSMTTRTEVFVAQLAGLRRAGYTVVPLATVVDGLAGRVSLPSKALAITVDDGHRTVYTDLLPIIRREHLPVTLFIYPSAISNASYAMTWEQLQELLATGSVSIQSHTWWHPDFRIERRRLDPAAYRQFVRKQLDTPRRILQSRLGVDAVYLSWPFGIVDAGLEDAARDAGYQAAFTLGERRATARDSPLALPRYLIADRSGVSGLLHNLQAGEGSASGARP
ncbi:MAG: polysaccharide deacetylase family protein [Proteobacteria bacterium]|nr:polysaccharide deacetylase family protein [Pseudomonadota bacterium]